MPKRLTDKSKYPQKERAFKAVLIDVRMGKGFSTVISETRWNLDQWNQWLNQDGKDYRLEALKEAEADGRDAALLILRDRAFAAYTKWLDNIDTHLSDGKGLTKTDVEQLRTMIEGRLPDLRQHKVAPEKIDARRDNGFGFEE